MFKKIVKTVYLIGSMLFAVSCGLYASASLAEDNSTCSLVITKPSACEASHVLSNCHSFSAYIVHDTAKTGNVVTKRESINDSDATIAIEKGHKIGLSLMQKSKVAYSDTYLCSDNGEIVETRTSSHLMRGYNVSNEAMSSDQMKLTLSQGTAKTSA